MRRLLTLALSAMVLVGCASNPVVQRVDPNIEIALTDKWNAEDSRLVADAMIGEMITFPWYKDWLRSGEDRPTIIVQTIRNKSHEHVSVDTFVNDIKRASLQTGKLRFVADSVQREALREEREAQDGYATVDSMSQWGKELGADFALAGVINSFVDEWQDRRVTSYQVDLTLINLETNEEVWIGQKKIQKAATF
ncbi:penicillin-binding protein activator LpoB [Salinibius halmophilus]|uniref:penicillin-binding protein activator LpoB n=1 Tax=Salinibius halmophilus TaxID=1853216 RepID=UPI000E667854|nr:penicillin-binding protein activator LpoB [Salinibius halmophilus]